MKIPNSIEDAEEWVRSAGLLVGLLAIDGTRDPCSLRLFGFGGGWAPSFLWHPASQANQAWSIVPMLRWRALSGSRVAIAASIEEFTYSGGNPYSPAPRPLRCMWRRR